MMSEKDARKKISDDVARSHLPSSGGFVELRSSLCSRRARCALVMLAVLSSSVSAFTPMLRPVLQSSRLTSPMMIANPYDAVAGPLRKFEAPDAAAGGSMLDGLPIEVVGLFAVILLVGVAGLVKSSGALSESAPTVGLGESREELTEEATAAADEAAAIADMNQADKEKKYFGEIANDLASKRGGRKKNRRKK